MRFFYTLILCSQMIFAQDISGVYEVAVGVATSTEMLEQIRYWEQFGYRIGSIGHLNADETMQLYGHASALTSVRMLHQEADHGLVRIMQWENPRNNGSGLTTSLRQEGSRWGAMLTSSVMNITNHAEDAITKKIDTNLVPPIWTQIYPVGKGEPFVDKAVGVREMLLLRPQVRQVFFERFNYQIPNYGKINEQSFFKSSQITHFGMVVRMNDTEKLKFYSDVLGLLHVKDETSTYETSRGGRPIFDLRVGETYYVHDYDDPRSSKNFMEARSGRLKIIRLPEDAQMEDHRNLTRPGSLGMSLYTLKSKNIGVLHETIIRSGVTEIFPIQRNEFGEQSFSFIAPDGYWWTIIG